MDQAILVINRLGGGQRLIEHLVRGGLEILAAFWLYTNDNERWTLKLVCKGIEEPGPMDPYMAVVQAFRELPDLEIEKDEVSLLGPRKPLARGVMKHLKQYPYKLARRVERTFLDDVYVESAYIYPPELLHPTEVAAKET